MTDLETLGKRLKQARKDKDLSRMALSQELNIPEGHIAALEAGRMIKGIDPVFQKGFARTLASYLEIDPAEASRAFQSVSSDDMRFNKIHVPEKLHDSHIPARALMLAAISALIVTVGGWFYLGEDDSQQASTVPPVPDHLARLLSPDEAAETGAPSASSEMAIQQGDEQATLSLTALEEVDLRILENREEVWSGHMRRGEQRNWSTHPGALIVADHPEAVSAILRTAHGDLMAEIPLVLTEAEYRSLLQKRASR